MGGECVLKEASGRMNQALAFVDQNCGALNATKAAEGETGVACRVCSLIASAYCRIASSSIIYACKNLK